MPDVLQSGDLVKVRDDSSLLIFQFELLDVPGVVIKKVKYDADKVPERLLIHFGEIGQRWANIDELVRL